jgi:hypothetical protein
MKRILHGALICTLIVVVSTALLPASVSAAGKAIYVDDDFLDDPSRHMWNTIQEGINDAANGAYDTVYVYAGTYTENVIVNKRNLTVMGDPSALVTINGGTSSYAIQITAHDVTVKQFTITGGSLAGVHWVGVDNGYLENVDVSGSTGHGVWMDNLTNQTIQCNTIYNNGLDGIRVTNSDLKDLLNNHTHHNIYGAGIRLENSTRITTAYNESNNNDYGIYVNAGSTLNDIYLNNFHDNITADSVVDCTANDCTTPGNPAPVPTCTPQAPPDPPTPATQNPPTNLTATAVLSDGETPTWTVELNWDDNSDDELGFKIERKVEGEVTYTQIDTVGAGVTSYTDTDVVGDTTYYYRVRAYSSGGDSPYSNEASATTSGGGGGCFIATAAYGSYLDSHVETLRDFRDRYMVNNPVGSALVSAYYKLSPPVADFIDAHPTLKPIVRAGLLPAVAMSTVALNTTSAEKIAIVGSLLLISILLIMWWRQRSRSPHTS